MKRSEYIENYYKSLFQKLTEQAYLLEKKLKRKTEELKKKKSNLDKVGKEDADVDNDGKPNTKADKYIMNRRAKIKAAMSAKKKSMPLKEGTVIGNDIMHYGGFPRIINENQGETSNFRDSVSDRQRNVATRRNHEEEPITWAPELVHGGYAYPSADLMSLAKTRDELSKRRAGMIRARGVLQPDSPEIQQIGQQIHNIQRAISSHPHFGEFRLGHPSRRNRQSTRITHGPNVNINSSREGT